MRPNKSGPTFVSSSGWDYRLEKNGETFLREVPIMRERVCDAPFSHRHHRDAVRQAIALVASSLIQIQDLARVIVLFVAGPQCPSASCFFEHSHHNAALSFTCIREVVEEFAENFIRSYQCGFWISEIERSGCEM